jgi:hypothetical protein
MDAISPCIYMLGPGCVDRDLAYIKAVVKYCRAKYPGKPVYVFSWGCYHEAWNGPGAMIPDAVNARVADTIWASGADGVIVWGPWSDNAAWVDALRKRSGAP